MQRREFLQTAGVLAAGATTMSQSAVSAESQKPLFKFFLAQ